ncbi:DUF4097 domain-containing protein [Solirubrobacter ginsenosidimutans]|uniref:DUF4097 domain-containing protein n=1 Tax=Solirubrobacter ginsenosidimutans TaxID=490573 RepID=A0A9X3MWC6_9ACTN|nr:DUF4097 family beta strand repeat-containing protein [Solirubrobacter ginsenosidimutans]MDA0163894.1 DUF4097 domain-containing protein [Solirubrobacter ginsenosidimutans]
MTARGQRAVALFCGLGLALLFAAIAAVQVAGWTIGAVERTTSQKLPGPIDQLVVEADGGDITIVPSLADVVRINSTVKGSIHTPEPHAFREGNTVHLNGKCPDISFGPCRARIMIYVPQGTPVEVHSGSGDLTASGLTGRVDLDTGSGDVNATGLTGAANLQTGSGDINVRGLTGTTKLQSGSGDISGEDLGGSVISADTSSGDVDFAFRWSPTVVEASTASGDVNIAVPSGDAYRVDADPGSGDQQIDVKTDPSADRTITASTSSGDVTVAYGN